MIEQLKAIGLTEIEAKCYLALYETPNQTGYEVAKTIGVSRSNVYASLASLHKKGCCVVTEGKTTTYTAVSIDDVLEKLSQEFKQSARALKRQLRRRKRDTFNFFTTTGDDAIQMVIQRSIAHANASVIADVWPQDLPIILPYLEEAQERGVKVVLITFNPITTTLHNVVVDTKGRAAKALSDFSILCDYEKAIVGSLDESVVASAVETRHPAIVKKVISEYQHDLIITQLSHDFADEIKTRYNGDLQTIVDAFESKLK
ncbi:TrmB family transcriptional regulator [Erysipelothrix sp. HDW6C]|uniref:TrmB family transcriptional regulator n=1 Tax=Erysipelothrix sp. HDW6C TaxID=2714930 RepID=UPI00140C4771|nr:TrmB family transcriptional regulator [Erysipelothrix sp. HDW6C]QIK69691.1 TrmB family transcriptional regulator [Erysipelothrix sp. HDW6C]